MSCRFLSRSRIKTQAEFQHIYQQAQRFVNRDKLAILANVNQLPYSRLGVVITKRNIKKAVARNQIKRIIRESFRFRQAVTSHPERLK